MRANNDEAHFRTFANSLERAIERYEGTSEEDVTERQKRQLETLAGYETRFRDLLFETFLPDGISMAEVVYTRFVHYIHVVRGNILAARPYFRERQTLFTEKISSALKAQDPMAFREFNINYQLVSFIAGGLTAEEKQLCPELLVLNRKIRSLRKELVELNLPLAISRVRIFWGKTQESHLEYMDFVQIAAEGLLSAIDKFVLPYTTVFRSVAIGRMVGNFIEEYSKTMFHFFPTDKRKLYRAHKVIGRIEDVDFHKIAAEVNRGVEQPHMLTTAEEIADLLSAVSLVSSETPVNTEVGESGTIAERFVAPDNWRPDSEVEAFEAQDTLRRAAQQLSVFERKFLRLRGIDVRA